jgi:hypothetical protein
MESTDRDVTRIVRSWMDEGVTALPCPARIHLNID